MNKDEYRYTDTLFKRSQLVSPAGDGFVAKVRAVAADNSRQLQSTLSKAKQAQGRPTQGMAGKKRTWLPGGVLVETWINPFGLVPTLVARVVFPETGGEEELEETSETAFIYYPISTEASYGWGTPFAVDGTPINPPLGTVLTSSAQISMAFRQYRKAERDKNNNWTVIHGGDALGGSSWKDCGGKILSWNGPEGWEDLATPPKNTGFGIFFEGVVLTTYPGRIHAVSAATKDNIDYVYALATTGSNLTIIRRVADWGARDVIGAWQISAPVEFPSTSPVPIPVGPFQADIDAACEEATLLHITQIAGASNGNFLWNWWELKVSWADAGIDADNYISVVPGVELISDAREDITKQLTFEGYPINPYNFSTHKDCYAYVKVPVNVKYSVDSLIQNRIELSIRANFLANDLYVDSSYYVPSPPGWMCEVVDHVWDHSYTEDIVVQVLLNDNIVADTKIADYNYSYVGNELLNICIYDMDPEATCLESTASGTINQHYDSHIKYLGLPLKKQNAAVNGIFVLNESIMYSSKDSNSYLTGMEYTPLGDCISTASGTISRTHNWNSEYNLEISSNIGTHTISSSETEIMAPDPDVERLDQDGTLRDFRVYAPSGWFLRDDPAITNNYVFGLGYWLCRIVGMFTPQGRSATGEDGFTDERYYWNIPPYAFTVSNFLPTGDFVGSFDEANTGDPPIPDLPTQVVFSGGDLLQLTESTGEDQRFERLSSVGIIR